MTYTTRQLQKMRDQLNGELAQREGTPEHEADFRRKVSKMSVSQLEREFEGLHSMRPAGMSEEEYRDLYHRKFKSQYAKPWTAEEHAAEDAAMRGEK